MRPALALLVLCAVSALAMPAVAAAPPRFTDKVTLKGEFLENPRELTVGVRGADRVRVKARSWSIFMDEDDNLGYSGINVSRWYALKRVTGITWRVRRNRRRLADATTGDLVRLDFKACNRSGCTRLRVWFHDCFESTTDRCKRASGPRRGIPFFPRH